MPSVVNSTPHGSSVGKDKLVHPRPRVQSPSSTAAIPSAAAVVPNTTAATVEWVKSQEVLKKRSGSATGAIVPSAGSSSVDGPASNASFDLAAGMADATTEIFYDTADSDPHHDAVHRSSQLQRGATVGCDRPPVPTHDVVAPSSVHSTKKKSDEREVCATARHTDSDLPMDVGGLSERADDTLEEDVDAMSYAESDNGLASSGAHCCGAVNHMAMSLRKRNEYKHAIQLTRAVQEDDAACRALSAALNQHILDPLVPSSIMLHRRHELVERVCFHVTQALRLAGVQCHVAFYVFGSVHLRTVLPDGDIDITIALLDGDGGGASIANSPSKHPGASTPTSTSSTPHQLPGTAQGSGLSSSNSSNMDLLPKVRDYLLATPSTGIFVDSLIFAEVRVLKLICEGLSIDFTVGQTGGTSTVCFLHQVDQKIGRQHLFKRTLLLLKAWANYEARILSGQGGYLGTYALTVMMIAILNTVLQRADGEEGGGANITPLSLMLNVFAYFSTFDFDTYCLTIYGPLPIAAMQRGGGAGTLHSVSVQSAASTVTCDFCEEDDAASGVVMWPTSHGVAISEAFVGECAATFGQGSADPAAATPPNATPLRTPPHRDVPSMPELQPSLASEEHATLGSRAENVSSSTTSSNPTTSNNPHEHRHLAGGGNKKGPRKSPPQFSATLLAAATAFPIRSMNVMDPLRPSSNLTRGVSRAHLMRIQAAMALGLQRCGQAVADCTSGRLDPIACVLALLPNTADVIDAFHLRQVMEDSARGEPLPEAFFGGRCHCSGCPQPTMLCVAEAYLRRPELVAITHGAHKTQDIHAEDKPNNNVRPHLPPDRFGHPNRGCGRRPSSSAVSHTGHYNPPQHASYDAGAGAPTSAGTPRHHHHHHHADGAYRGGSASSYVRPTDIAPEESLASRIFPASAHQHHHHYPSYLNGLPNRRNHHRAVPHATAANSDGGAHAHHKQDGMGAAAYAVLPTQGGFQTHVTAAHHHHHHVPHHYASRSAQPQQPLTTAAASTAVPRQHVDPFAAPSAPHNAELVVEKQNPPPPPPQQPPQQREVTKKRKGARQQPGGAIRSSSSTPPHSEPPPLNSELFPSLPS